MARMPSKRWMEMVGAISSEAHELDSHMVITDKQAVKLLSRQHNAFVRLVKKLQRYNVEYGKEVVESDNGGLVLFNDLLAALQQGGKK